MPKRNPKRHGIWADRTGPVRIAPATASNDQDRKSRKKYK